jgi:hypothetical protein
VNADVAYDATSGRYLIVWLRRSSCTNGQIMGRLVTATGSALGSPFPIRGCSTDYAQVDNPTVANVNVSNRFLVAWQEKGVGPTATWNIRGCAVRASDASRSKNIINIGFDASADDVTPDAGGDPLESPNRSNALVVWRNDARGAIRARCVYVPETGDLPDPAGPDLIVTLGGPSKPDSRPAVSKSSGEAGCWLVVWQRLQAVGDHGIFGRAISRCQFCTPERGLATSTGIDSQEPDCATIDGRRFLVVWQRDSLAYPEIDNGILARHVWLEGYCPTASLAIDPNHVEVSTADGNEVNPAVDFNGYAYLVAWAYDRGGSASYDIRMASLMARDDLDACWRCERRYVYQAQTRDGYPEIAARFGGGAPFATTARRQALCVWQSTNAAGVSGDVFGKRLSDDCPIVIDWSRIGGGGTTFPLDAPFQGNAGFRMGLFGADGPAAMLLLGFTRWDLACDGGLVVPTPHIALGGAAPHKVPIPSDGSLVGTRMWAQHVVLAPKSCIHPLLSFGSAVELTFTDLER